MTAELVAFRRPSDSARREALLAAAIELHALITIDPILGASPVRIYFVLNPEAKVRIAACLGRGAGDEAADGYALVAYDFPLALHQFELSSRIPRERAKAIITCSSELQESSLQRAAEALGIDARSVPSFDADALKATFFPNTQETVAHVFRLAVH